MKKTIIMALICLASAGVIAQNCKYEKNETDKFTNKQMKQTKSQKVIASFNTEGLFSILKIDTSYFMTFDYVISKVTKSEPASVVKGQLLQFLLEDGSMVSIRSTEDIKGTHKMTVGVPPMHHNHLTNVTYYITLNDLKTLGKSKVKTIRFYCNEGNGKETPNDNEINKRNSDDIQEMVKCML